MMRILTKVLDWMRQRPKVRILVCFVSCVVGLVCYALSSSFNELIEKLKWRKMVPYIVLCLILIFVDVGFTKRPHRSRAILVLVLVATCVYSSFVDEIVEVKPDACILVSYAAFAIMSLFLSTLSHIGFEVELLYFFTCTLIIQLMKIKSWLAIFGWGFMEVLVRLRPTLDPALRSGSRRGVVRDRNDVGIDVENPHPQGTRLTGSQEDLPQEVHVPPPQNEDEVGLLVSHVSSSQGVTDVSQENEEGNSDNSDIVMARFINVLSDETSSLISNEVNQVRMILANFERLKGVLTNGYEAQGTAADGIHFLTRAVMDYIRDEFIKRDGSLGRCFEEYAMAAKEGNLSPSVLVETIINLLENNLEATSRSCETPSLGYVFIMINQTFIAHEIERLGLEPIIGHDWIKGNQDKIEHNLQLYLRSSWYKILKFLNVDFYYVESEHDVFDLMENNLSSFNQQLDEICYDKSMWLVFDDKLRDQIIKSIKNILLPAYREFIKSYEDLFPKFAYMIIKPEVHVVEHRLNNLFLESADESDAKREEKKNV